MPRRCALRQPDGGAALLPKDMGIDQIEVPAEQRLYGYTGNNHTIKTPHIFRLASEGLVFQHWYSGYHVCSPSRAAMMVSGLPISWRAVRSPLNLNAGPALAQTGRLPIRSGCAPAVFYADAVGGLPANETTMAEALGAHGYRTMAIGKWYAIQPTPQVQRSVLNFFVLTASVVG